MPYKMSSLIFNDFQVCFFFFFKKTFFFFLKSCPMQILLEKFPSFFNTRNTPKALKRKVAQASLSCFSVFVFQTQTCYVSVVWTDSSPEI